MVHWNFLLSHFPNDWHYAVQKKTGEDGQSLQTAYFVIDKSFHHVHCIIFHSLWNQRWQFYRSYWINQKQIRLFSSSSMYFYRVYCLYFHYWRSSTNLLYKIRHNESFPPRGKIRIIIKWNRRDLDREFRFHSVKKYRTYKFSFFGWFE